VQNPDLYYQKGQVFLKITEIEKGVKLYVNAGENTRNSTAALVPKNGTVSVG